MDGGDPVEEHGCITLNQQDSKLLEQLLDGHVLLLPRAPCLGPGDPLDLVLLCYPPSVSTEMGMNVMPSLSHAWREWEHFLLKVKMRGVPRCVS